MRSCISVLAVCTCVGLNHRTVVLWIEARVPVRVRARILEAPAFVYACVRGCILEARVPGRVRACILEALAFLDACVRGCILEARVPGRVRGCILGARVP